MQNMDATNQSEKKQVSERLQKILDSERTHKQWGKLGQNFLIFAIYLLMNLFRGGKRTESIIDLEVCSAGDWIIQAFFICCCVSLICYSVKSEMRT